MVFLHREKDILKNSAEVFIFAILRKMEDGRWKKLVMTCDTLL
jgi:hypothetical protein